MQENVEMVIRQADESSVEGIEMLRWRVASAKECTLQQCRVFSVTKNSW